MVELEAAVMGIGILRGPGLIVHTGVTYWWILGWRAVGNAECGGKG